MDESWEGPDFDEVDVIGSSQSLECRRAADRRQGRRGAWSSRPATGLGTSLAYLVPAALSAK